MYLGVVEILILKQFKKLLLITCRSSMNNTKVRSLCMCNKSEENEKFMNVVEVSNYSRYRLQAVVKARAAQALVFWNPGVRCFCTLKLELCKSTVDAHRLGLHCAFRVQSNMLCHGLPCVHCMFSVVVSALVFIISGSCSHWKSVGGMFNSCTWGW